jgi:DNA-binding transcriptional ArsR family regulator
VVKVTLDAETFKALASATRLLVLRALDERRKTLTELSRELDLNKATVHEHLQLLTAADLVKKRDDEGRKWVYYELTWRGQKILHPQETTTFNVLLGLGMAAAGGGTLMLLRALQQANDKVQAMDQGFKLTSEEDSGAGSPQPASSPPEGDPSPTPSPSAPEDRAVFATEPVPDATQDTDTSFFDEGGWLAIALMACAILFAALAIVLRRKLQGRPPNPASLEEDAAASAGKDR